ncbi:DUF1350 family protein [Stenomitos frigidus]|uniref:DUF1350 domain-containing protein n=1 Tax=Stenomitos frigidus ULC18 TaxID=2107698 RepID=A0A2T1EB00_9CYAN|nr:DUF1350 family protein [Stenomitos frigidus]PSB29932.1 hypothetical protein C7B82_10295 [Stenomitos frigidus ULC18]
MDWQEISGNWVLVPPRPTAIIHFLGGAFVATAPHVTYRRFLEQLAAQGYVIVATPFVNTFDHTAIANTVLRSFERTLETLHTTVLRKRYLPIYGVGHSMGCKLHLLIGSLFPVERAGNVLIAFNNFSARNAVPLVEQFSPVFAVEFTPSPLETNQLVSQNYQVRRNLLVKFTNDTIDQTTVLTDVLQTRFPGMVVAQTLPGNHLTPLGPDVKWQAGELFTPLDAIGQWVRQEVYRELHQLERAILRWLDPLASFS